MENLRKVIFEVFRSNGEFSVRPGEKQNHPFQFPFQWPFDRVSNRDVRSNSRSIGRSTGEQQRLRSNALPMPFTGEQQNVRSNCRSTGSLFSIDLLGINDHNF
ncbi:hypothetical protein SLA2020_274770 [Shorea laevis]